QGALIIDVRTPREFDGGHIPEALNIPLDRIGAGSDGLQRVDRPLILCCSTGQRSKQALRMLRKRGITSIYNGGNWMRLLERMKRD
ncbi:MAG: hypothetical protein RJA57_1368, partial [Bacteroidota bacterium]